MSVLLLVRHGQASFGAADYDVLSDTGHEQSRILGAALTERGIAPTRAFRGAMKRHTETAEAAGFTDAVLDDGWNEFDHVQVLAAHTPPESAETVTENKAFQRWFEEATRRWMDGEHDEEYDESFGAFTARVDAALHRAVARAGRGDTAVIFTSGGAIAAVAATLLGGGPDLWQRLNSVTVNAGITKVVVGSRGATLVSFNDHLHLDPDLVTYR